MLGQWNRDPPVNPNIAPVEPEDLGLQQTDDQNTQPLLERKSRHDNTAFKTPNSWLFQILKNVPFGNKTYRKELSRVNSNQNNSTLPKLIIISQHIAWASQAQRQFESKATQQLQNLQHSKSPSRVREIAECTQRILNCLQGKKSLKKLLETYWDKKKCKHPRKFDDCFEAVRSYKKRIKKMSFGSKPRKKTPME